LPNTIGTPSCPRGQSSRLRLPCRPIERRQRMRIQLRGNTRRRSACLVVRETFVSQGSRIRGAAQANRSRRSKGIRATCCCCGASRASSPFRRERYSLSAIDACRLEPRSMMPLWYAPNSAIASFVRIRTDFRLARRSKWRNDGPKRAHRPPHGHALPRAEFPCAGLFASDHRLELFRYFGFVHRLNCLLCTDSDRVQAGKAIQKARPSTMAGEQSAPRAFRGLQSLAPGVRSRRFRHERGRWLVLSAPEGGQ
jgi:hypothetical protein